MIILTDGVAALLAVVGIFGCIALYLYIRRQ